MDIILLHYKTFFLLLAILNLVLGALLLIWPNALANLNKNLKKWISLERLVERTIDKPRDIDEHIIKMRKIFGTICIVLAAILISLYVKN